MANIRVTELDFDQIKENFKTYLRNQTQFTDYDFEGSNLSVLIDLLAYNTHYNAILANMVSNEMFLDTAIKRSSVASLAKHLRYTGRSIRSAKAKVDVVLQNIPGNPNFATLEKYTPFITNIDGKSYTFYNIDTYTTSPLSGDYTFKEVELYQGRYLEFYYTVGSTPSPADRYQIPNPKVDTSTLKVSVQYSGTSSYSETYSLMNDATQVNATSRVYYLEEDTQGYYDIFFGDGVLGYQPQAGDVVKIGYLISDGTAGNVSQNVPVNWTTATIAGEGNRSITTISKPSGGADAETQDQIRFNAIKRYSTFGRAITADDYSSIIMAEVPGAESVNVWGGENNTPPVYGKVYISIKPYTGYVLTTAEKDRIVADILRPRGIVTTQHEFVDPIYTYLKFNSTIKYNSALTNRTANQIASLVNAKITEFIGANLERFNQSFYASQMQEQIVALDDSIVSVIIVIGLQKRITVAPNSTYSGTVVFPGRLHPGAIKTNKYVLIETDATYTVQMRDIPDSTPADYSGTGTLKIFDLATGRILVDNAGTVNYATGSLNINALKVSGYIGSSIDIRINAEVQEASRDITPGYDEILVLDDTAADTLSALENGIGIDVINITRK
jgi:hypothetical protein